MSSVRVHMMMSLDGYVAGPNISAAKPFGDIPDEFLSWVLKLESFQELMGGKGGETGPSSDVIRETMQNLGATIMGRRMFGGGEGGWDESWKGWWGDNPPFHTPVFVLTHHPRPPLEMNGGTTFHFVTDGIESALRRARQTAGDLDVRIGGGGSAAHQYLAAGLVDELELHIVPVLIGDGGVRIFDGLSPTGQGIEPVRTISGGYATHVKYRILK